MTDAQTPFEPATDPADEDEDGDSVVTYDAISISDKPTKPRNTSDTWAIPMLCIGLAILACCVILPQVEANRRLVYERQKLTNDLESVKQQVQSNQEFLERINSDPTLAERLAQRQMKMVREGTSVLELKHQDGVGEMSPFMLVAVAPAKELPPYRPTGGVLGKLFSNSSFKLYLMGGALFLIAMGLVLGGGTKKKAAEAA